MVVNGFRSWIKLRILFQHQFNFLLLIIQYRKTILVNTLSHLAVGEQFLGPKLLRPLERKSILKAKLASYSQFHKWKLSNQEELLALSGLLTISIKTYIYQQAWDEILLEYQRPVLEAHQFFWPVFTKNRLLMLHSMLHFWENEGGSNVWVSNWYIIYWVRDLHWFCGQIFCMLWQQAKQKIFNFTFWGDLNT